VVEDLFEISGSGESADVLLRLHVQPGAGRSAVVGRHGHAVKLKVAAPPTGGRANAAVIALLAESFGVAPSEVSLESGELSRAKRVRIRGVDPAEFRRRLEILVSVDKEGRGAGPRS